MRRCDSSSLCIASQPRGFSRTLVTELPQHLGKGILFGVDFLVAAGIIPTVVLKPTL